MKTIILIVTALLLSLPAWGAIWPFGDKKEVVKESEKSFVCYRYFDVGKGVKFVFRGGCEELKHVGIIDVRENKIIILDDSLDEEFRSDFTSTKARIDFTEKMWKGLTPVKYGKITN